MYETMSHTLIAIMETNSMVKYKNKNLPDPQTTNKNRANSHGLTGVLFFSDF